jgi:glutamate synthase (NADPH/NADH) small chain
VETGRRLGHDLTLEALRAEFDAVFLGVGLGAVNALGVEGEAAPGVRDAVDFIAELRQADDPSALPVGRKVVVIGGGMTAIDAAVQSRLLGAEEVTIVYRRDRAAMSASRWEQDQATAKGVVIRTNARPARIAAGDAARAAEFARTDGDREETLSLPADQVLKAIGQRLSPDIDAGLRLSGGRIAVDAEGRTSLEGVWAGGDCAAGGDDLTVTAVAQGRDAAESIHRLLAGA